MRPRHPHRPLALLVAGMLLVGVLAMLRGTPPPGASTRARPQPAAATSPDVIGSALAFAQRDRTAARLSGTLRSWLWEHPEVGSVSLAVGRVGQEQLDWQGSAAVGVTAPLHESDPYGVLSVTKTFTEALVLRAAAAGLLQLDAPVPPVPGIATVPESPPITPRMLLQHTSGVVNYMSAVGYDAKAPMSPQLAVTISLASPRVAPPGTRVSYSNTNYHWLGLLLEHVTGRPFGALVADLATLVGLRDTWVDSSERPGWTGYASGGIRSTVGDLTRWGMALFEPGRVLDERALASMTTVGPLGAAMGLTPICPCGVRADGSRWQSAFGQLAANGGILYQPSTGMVLTVRFAKSPRNGPRTVASLADALMPHVGRH